jgi:hypothetical protein
MQASRSTRLKRYQLRTRRAIMLGLLAACILHVAVLAFVIQQLGTPEARLHPVPIAVRVVPAPRPQQRVSESPVVAESEALPATPVDTTPADPAREPESSPAAPEPRRELDLSLPADSAATPVPAPHVALPFDRRLAAQIERRRSEQADAAQLALLQRQRYGLSDEEYAHDVDGQTRAVKHEGRCYELRQDLRDPMAPAVWTLAGCRDGAARRHWFERDRIPDRFLR